MKNERLPPVAHFMMMSQDNVFDKFYTVKDCYSDGSVEDQTRFIFIPGTRPDKALLVSHADHVFGKEEIKVDFAEGVLFSRYDRRTAKIEKKYENYSSTSFGVGIAADDRTGTYICWKLRNSGHSILITSGEERGCSGIKFIMESEYWRKTLNDHVFAIEFDRMNSQDAVFYDVGTNRFQKYVQEKTGYKPAKGFGSDIKYCCKSICGTNLSVGYYGQHSSDERQVLDQLENTLKITEEWLRGPLERFPLEKSDLFEIKYDSTTSGNTHSYRDEYDDCYGYLGHSNSTRVASNREIPSPTPTPPTPSTKNQPLGHPNQVWFPYRATEEGLIKVERAEGGKKNEQRIICPNEKCKELIKVEDWFINKCKCTKCNTIII